MTRLLATDGIPMFGDPGQWSRWLGQQLSRCDDLAFGERFAALVPFEGIHPASYQHRILHVNNAQLLAGIRFKGGLRTFPFIDLIAWSGEPTNAWPDALARSFEEFHPCAFRWASTGNASKQPWPREVDQHIVAGQPNGRAHPLIRAASDLSWFDTFENAFREWQATSPLACEVTPADESELADCLATGHVVVAIENDDFIGVAACKPAAERAFDGWCIIEEFVIPSRRREGLGTALQRSVMSRLPRGSTVWGTIHGSNEASLAVAHKCGRRIAETWWFARFHNV